eukprot:m.29524 g.29524  ORF g.29524 m.29524 type:complete len:60 (+) comp14365_c0_seq2:304-483(+)
MLCKDNGKNLERPSSSRVSEGKIPSLFSALPISASSAPPFARMTDSFAIKVFKVPLLNT